MLAFEDAEIIDDLAYERYVIEQSLPRVSGNELAAYQNTIKDCVRRLEMYKKKNHITSNEWKNTRMLIDKIRQMHELIYKVRYEDMDKYGDVNNGDYHKKYEFVKDKTRQYIIKYQEPIGEKYYRGKGESYNGTGLSRKR